MQDLKRSMVPQQAHVYTVGSKTDTTWELLQGAANALGSTLGVKSSSPLPRSQYAHQEAKVITTRITSPLRTPQAQARIPSGMAAPLEGSITASPGCSLAVRMTRSSSTASVRAASVRSEPGSTPMTASAFPSGTSTPVGLTPRSSAQTVKGANRTRSSAPLPRLTSGVPWSDNVASNGLIVETIVPETPAGRQEPLLSQRSSVSDLKEAARSMSPAARSMSPTRIREAEVGRPTGETITSVASITSLAGANTTSFLNSGFAGRKLAPARSMTPARSATLPTRSVTLPAKTPTVPQGTIVQTKAMPFQAQRPSPMAQESRQSVQLSPGRGIQASMMNRTQSPFSHQSARQAPTKSVSAPFGNVGKITPRYLSATSSSVSRRTAALDSVLRRATPAEDLPQSAAASSIPSTPRSVISTPQRATTPVTTPLRQIQQNLRLGKLQGY